VLRAERRREPHVAERGDGVERVVEPRGDGRRMRQQRDTAAGQRAPQRGLGEQPVEAELHHEWLRSICSTKLAGSWKSGRSPGWVSAQYGMAAVGALDHRRQAEAAAWSRRAARAAFRAV